MSSSEQLAKLPSSDILESTAVRREFQNAWNQISEVRAFAEEEGIRGVTESPPTSPRSFRTDDVTQTELSSSGHGLPRPAAGNHATHWLQATAAQRPLQNSGLLKLPPEILDDIIGYVVGYEVLHVNHAEAVREYHTESCYLNEGTCQVAKGHGPQFQLSPCLAPVSEERAWHQFRFGYEEIPKPDDKQYYVEDGWHRHQDCWEWATFNCDCTKKPGLFKYAACLSVFRVCSQFSLSAFRIFWATNTFSFGTTLAFGKLISALNDTQLGAIRNIDLNFKADPEPMEFDPCKLMKLQSLDTLNLCLHNYLLGAVSDEFNNKPELSELDLRKKPISDILRLEVLDIKRLNVIIYDNYSDYTWSTGEERFEMRFTVDEKFELSCAVSKILTAPKVDRGVFAQEDRQIFELEELIKGLRFAQDVRWQIQRRDFTP